jgi:hypothetical protein
MLEVSFGHECKPELADKRIRHWLVDWTTACAAPNHRHAIANGHRQSTLPETSQKRHRHITAPWAQRGPVRRVPARTTTVEGTRDGSVPRPGKFPLECR